MTIAEGPQDAAVLADSVGLALLAVLDTLTPPERLNVPVAVVGFTVADGRIVEIDLIAEPAKLARVGLSESA